MRYDYGTFFENQTVTNETVTSEFIEMRNFLGFSLTFQWSGTDVNGYQIIEVSNDNINWIEQNDSSELIRGAGPHNSILNQEPVYFRYMRHKIISLDANTITFSSFYMLKGYS